MGDGWSREVKVEKVLARDPKVSYPVCLVGELACPPEDCGGVWGYADLVTALQAPYDPQWAELLEWAGPFDPRSSIWMRSTLSLPSSGPVVDVRHPSGDEHRGPASAHDSHSQRLSVGPELRLSRARSRPRTHTPTVFLLRRDSRGWPSSRFVRALAFGLVGAGAWWVASATSLSGLRTAVP